MLKILEKPVEVDLNRRLELINVIENEPGNLRIDPNNFRGVTTIVDGRRALFDSRVIKEDLDQVEKKKKWIEENESKLSGEERLNKAVALFVESAIPSCIRKFNWLGNVRVIRPSLYDDYFNGIDCAIQIFPEEIVESDIDIRCMGFSIDFTISEKAKEKKLYDIINTIADGKTPSMKYFETEIRKKDGLQEIKRREFLVPKVVITCSKKWLDESLGYLDGHFKDLDNLIFQEKVRNMALKYLVIRDSIIQLELFAVVAEIEGNSFAQKAYLNSLSAFKKILNELKINREDLDKRVDAVERSAPAFDPNTHHDIVEMWIKAAKEAKENKKRGRF